MKNFEDLVACINRAGEIDAPIHLKIKAYHVDVGQGDCAGRGIEMAELADMLMPQARKW